MRIFFGTPLSATCALRRLIHSRYGHSLLDPAMNVYTEPAARMASATIQPMGHGAEAGTPVDQAGSSQGLPSVCGGISKR